MAHGIQSMAFVGEVPWHGLGNRLTPDSPLEIWAKEAGMDWNLLSTPALGLDDTDEVFLFPERNILYRSDTKAPLSIVSDAYKVVQPGEVLEFYRDLVATADFKLHTAGVLFGGKKFWALAEVGESVRIMGQDKIDGYLLLATSCDGSLATTAQFTTVRVVCNNTLTISIRDEQGKPSTIKVPHHSTFDPEQVKAQLGLAKDGFAQFAETAEVLAKRKVTDKEAVEFLVRAWNNVSEVTEETLETSDSKNVKALFQLFKGEGKGSNLRSADGTAWGLVNAITEFCDHRRQTKTADNRLNSAWFGQGATIKGRAWDEALRLVA